MYEYRNLSVDERKILVEDRLRNGFPPHSPPHIAGETGQYLITVACYNHQHHVNSAKRRRELLDQLFAAMLMSGFEVEAWAVLTNHYHLLVHIDELSRASDVFQKVHGSSSYRWNQEDGQQGRKVWYRFSDRAIRSERHYWTTLNYIHFNPVKHGLVESPYDWEWSSVHWYLEEFGRQWLRDCWARYPVRNYGVGWDDL